MAKALRIVVCHFVSHIYVSIGLSLYAFVSSKRHDISEVIRSYVFEPQQCVFRVKASAAWRLSAQLGASKSPTLTSCVFIDIPLHTNLITVSMGDKQS